MTERIALYVVGCQSWHENLKATFNENVYKNKYNKTWLQYNVDIRREYRNHLSHQIQKFGSFFVYGHTKNEDYQFDNSVKYEQINNKIICINKKCNELIPRNKIKIQNAKNGACVSVIYAIHDDIEHPIVHMEKQPRPNGSPDFRAYDITDGGCVKTKVLDCNEIDCNKRKQCNCGENRCYYEFAYETWLPVAKIIEIKPIRYDNFRFRGKKVTVGQLRYEHIFPVGLLPEHKELLRNMGYQMEI